MPLLKDTTVSRLKTIQFGRTATHSEVRHVIRFLDLHGRSRIGDGMVLIPIGDGMVWLRFGQSKGGCGQRLAQRGVSNKAAMAALHISLPDLPATNPLGNGGGI